MRLVCAYDSGTAGHLNLIKYPPRRMGASKRKAASASSDDLTCIPGVGPRMAADLKQLGHPTVSSLVGADPDRLYKRICEPEPVDRCVLYVFRCSVYYAEGGRDTERLKWWSWKTPADNEALKENKRARAAAQRKPRAPASAKDPGARAVYVAASASAVPPSARDRAKR